MAEAQNKTTKEVWSAYECPACFGVFRVPKGNEHREAICPRCETILRLVDAPEIVSEKQDVAPMLPAMVETLGSTPSQAPAETAVYPEAQSSPSAREAEEGKPVVRKRRRTVQSSLESDWESVEQARRNEEAWKLPVILLIAGILILLGSLVVVDIFKKKPRGSSNGVVPVLRELGLDDDVSEELGQEISPQIDIETDQELIVEAVHLFFDAENKEEILSAVRPVKEISSKLERFYAEQPYRLTKVKGVAEDAVFSMVDGFVSVNVIMDDFEVRPIALEKVDDRFSVDWESWVGYSELSWKEFFDIKPRRGREFRVLVSPVDYYNYDFTDDRKWQSFRITSWDKKTVVYGYLPSNSLMVTELTPIDPSIQEAAFVLKLSYPLKSSTQNQVLIEEVLCSGWVVPRE